MSQIEFEGLYAFIHPQISLFNFISADIIDVFLKISLQYMSKKITIPGFII